MGLRLDLSLRLRPESGGEVKSADVDEEEEEEGGEEEEEKKKKHHVTIKYFR